MLETSEFSFKSLLDSIVDYVIISILFFFYTQFFYEAKQIVTKKEFKILLSIFYNLWKLKIIIFFLLIKTLISLFYFSNLFLQYVLNHNIH
jgi:hypothetical protein